jgi:hypothetical protein
MTKEMWIEVGSAVVFCVLALLLINPMHFWMPTMSHMTVLGLAAIALAAFIVFVLRESAQDERDDTHRAMAGRAAFLAGSAVLILGIIVQNASHQIDTWLVATLIAMVLAKVVARMWSRWYC